MSHNQNDFSSCYLFIRRFTTYRSYMRDHRISEGNAIDLAEYELKKLCQNVLIKEQKDALAKALKELMNDDVEESAAGKSESVAGLTSSEAAASKKLKNEKKRKRKQEKAALEKAEAAKGLQGEYEVGWQ